jgi:hypothetical protein
MVAVDAKQVITRHLDVAHSRVVAELVELCRCLDDPKRQPAERCDEEQPVVALLEPEPDAGEAQRDPPALDREKTLVEARHEVGDLVVLADQVVMKAGEPGIFWIGHRAYLTCLTANQDARLAPGVGEDAVGNPLQIILPAPANAPTSLSSATLTCAVSAPLPRCSGASWY